MYSDKINEVKEKIKNYEDKNSKEKVEVEANSVMKLII